MGSLAIPSELHFVKGIDPVADMNNGAVSSDIIEVGGEGIMFIYYKGVSTGGTDNAILTVLASDDTSASTTSAVPFWYKKVATTDTGWTAAPTTGFSITAGSSGLYVVAAPKDVFASTGYKYAKLLCTQVTDDPVVGCVLACVYGLRYSPQPASLID